MNRIAFFFAVLALALSLQAGSGSLRRTNPVQAISKVAREVVTGSGIGAHVQRNLVTMARRSVRDQMPSTPQMTEMLDEVFEEMEEEMRLQRRAMLNRAARIMARRLTEEELSEIAAFFNSPGG